MLKKMRLEVCVDSYLSLKTAVAAGADRIELCSALNLGGLTPSYGLMQQAIELRERLMSESKSHKPLEIVVMIRPHGFDFTYHQEELETMALDIANAKDMGFDGIVIGVLLPSGRLDLIQLEAMVTLAKPMTLVLHRAFDVAVMPHEDVPALIEMGFSRILTSGQKPTALEGATYIKSLQEDYGHLINIMPGAGINPGNISDLITITGCTDYHMSGKVTTKNRQEASYEIIKETRNVIFHE